MSLPHDRPAMGNVHIKPQKIRYIAAGGGRFPRSLADTIGRGIHRSGWSECYTALASSGLNIIIDDFLEQTITVGRGRFFHHQPFVAFFHHPPDEDIPSFAFNGYAYPHSKLFSTLAWAKSARFLVAAFSLTEHLAAYLRNHLTVPVFVVRHPTDTNVPQWSPRAFSKRPRVIQIGAFYRDTRAICRLSASVEKLRLLDLRVGWIKAWDEAVAGYLGPPAFPGNIPHLNRVSNRQYDELLSSSVVLAHFLAASASNVVVECLARNTPLIVNRLPSIVEYLGSDYPLYADQLCSNYQLFERQVVDAHLYLAGLDKEWLAYDRFVGDVVRCLHESHLLPRLQAHRAAPYVSPAYPDRRWNANAD